MRRPGLVFSMTAHEMVRSGGARKRDQRPRVWRKRRLSTRGSAFAATAILSILSLPSTRAAQSATSDAQDARIDAILATPGQPTSAPQTNLIATAPGLEQQAPSSQLRFNLLVPFGYNSNAEEIRAGGTPTSQLGSAGNLSWAVPLFELPVRLTANVAIESERFTESSDSDVDKIGGSIRLQYVDQKNDQAFSPYIAYAPRFDFIPTFSSSIATRQDVNFGFNKRYNLDGNFQSVPLGGNTSASTVWSFGLTVVAQRRLRDPGPSSSALFIIPSISYVISDQWNASFAIEMIDRRFDSNGVGFFRRDTEVQPIVTLEYVIPSALFGTPETARTFGRPALDFQTSYVRNWSNLPLRDYSQWTASIVLKTGWRF